MKKLLVIAAALGAAGCASLTDSVENGAVNAAGGVADHAVSSAGDRAADSAIDHAANHGSNDSHQATPVSAASTKLESDDVLVLDGSNYAVAKMVNGSALVIADGHKIASPTVVNVRAASRTELAVGADVFYCADPDVRRGRWAKGSVTDSSKLSDGHVDVGSARSLDAAAQVAVAK